MNRKTVLTSLMIGIISCGAIPAAAQTTVTVPGHPTYLVKPSDVSVPEGVPFGQYRRSFRPFDDWTLVCDENLFARKLICNVSQTIVDASGQTVFSWSLAAAEGGGPHLILRTAPDADAGYGVDLLVSDMKAPRKVRLEGCDQSVCLATFAVSPAMMRAIGNGEAASVAYRAKTGQMRRMLLPLRGLKEAVASIGNNKKHPPTDPKVARPEGNKAPR